jgi:hypothetical protein
MDKLKELSRGRQLMLAGGVLLLTRSCTGRRCRST